MRILKLTLPCWLRLVLALGAAGWIGASATAASAQDAPEEGAPAAAGARQAPAADGLDEDAAAVLRKATDRAERPRPIDRAFVVGLVGEPKGTPLTGAALEAKTHEIASLLRCPVCQGSAVADSPSATAVNMKNEVRDLVALGFDKEQILRYFEASYGQFVLMEPKREGFNLLVWIVPALLLLGGIGVVAATIRRFGGGRQTEAAAADVPGRGELPDDPELARYVRLVREQVWGWPGGEPPANLAGKGGS